jgi:hypothetical protein
VCDHQRDVVVFWAVFTHPFCGHALSQRHLLNAGDLFFSKCGNVASTLELDEHLAQEYKVFHHAAAVRRILFCIFMNQLWFTLSYPGYEIPYD